MSPITVRSLARSVPAVESHVVEAREWLARGVRGIGSASLLADLGHEIPTALLPTFLTSTLGAPAAALGLVEGVADGLAGATRFAGGALAIFEELRRVDPAHQILGLRLNVFVAILLMSAAAAWLVQIQRRRGDPDARG